MIRGGLFIFYFALLQEFEGKVVLNVRAGTGLLSMWAIQAGARCVVAVDNSNIIEQVRIDMVRIYGHIVARSVVSVWLSYAFVWLIWYVRRPSVTGRKWPKRDWVDRDVNTSL